MFLKSENNNEVRVITNDTSLKINVFGKLLNCLCTSFFFIIKAHRGAKFGFDCVYGCVGASFHIDP